MLLIQSQHKAPKNYLLRKQQDRKRDLLPMELKSEPRLIRKLEKKLRKANQTIDTLESQLTAERELHVKYKSKCKSLRHKISKFEADKTVLTISVTACRC
ncbi:unnamed protein product [Allacma fusca]|uniref:Uncharacterized protein n=1 Tax=Allacma fusca TaxID=39272 RepID=A0A8J2PCA4_9HEXA|nr:unnamed protein product [Allacma fusca]